MVYPNYYYRYNNYYNSKMSNFNLQKKEEIEHAKEPQNVDTSIKKDIEENRNINSPQKRISSKHNSFANLNFSNLFSSNLEEPVLEILGIKLYFDDILILGLLFFLYTEGVKDEILFISLILLLLS